MLLYLLVFTLLEKKLKKIRNVCYLFKNNKNKLTVCLNKHFSENYFPKQKLRRMVLFYIFVNLFIVWLKRRQLDSHICFIL